MRLVAAAAAAAALLAPTAPAAPLPDAPDCPVFPASSVWNKPVNKLPRHKNSAAIVKAIGAIVWTRTGRFRRVSRNRIQTACPFAVTRSRSFRISRTHRVPTSVPSVTMKATAMRRRMYRSISGICSLIVRWTSRTTTVREKPADAPQQPKIGFA
jgi:hypothetical protein